MHSGEYASGLAWGSSVRVPTHTRYFPEQDHFGQFEDITMWCFPELHFAISDVQKMEVLEFLKRQEVPGLASCL